MRILYVDDEARIRMGIEAMLHRLGHAVLSCDCGETALMMLRRCILPMDLLITDIEMPTALDGWATARAARCIQPELRVLYLTASPFDQSRAVPQGRHLRKPCTATALDAALRGIEFVMPLARPARPATARARAIRRDRLPLAAG